MTRPQLHLAQVAAPHRVVLFSNVLIFKLSPPSSTVLSRLVVLCQVCQVPCQVTGTGVNFVKCYVKAGVVCQMLTPRVNCQLNANAGTPGVVADSGVKEI